jgi:electron transfer flavoprotein alpha subunit
VLPASSGLPRRLAAELLGEAKRLADDAGGETVAAVIGGTTWESTPEELASWGASRVLKCDAADIARFHPEQFAAVTAAAIEAKAPLAVLFPGTSIGTDLGVRTALILDRRFIGGGVDFAIEADGMCVTRPTVTGRFQTKERIGNAPYLTSLVPDTVGSDQPAVGREAFVEPFDSPTRSSAKLKDCGFVPGDPKSVDIVDAEIIVAGGRGVGTADGFRLVEDVADLIGGSVAASRPAVEADWAPFARQVGQTGRIVAPRLYMACGISGASPHLAGIGDAETVVSINTDRGAPITSVAKLAIVGDVKEVLTSLADLLRKRTEDDAA